MYLVYYNYSNAGPECQAKDKLVLKLPFSFSIQELLFPTRDGKTLRERVDIPLLKVRYPAYKSALHTFINNWLEGRVGTGAPTEKWDRNLVRKINEYENKVEDSGEIPGKDIPDLCDVLKEWKVHNHLMTVNSHRNWLRLTIEFVEKVGIDINESVKELVRIHDLSKYTHWETLGYAVMFGDCQEGFRHLGDTDEKAEWQTSLEHHFAVNPHHPEYFFPKLEDGQRDKTKGMLDSDAKNGEDFLIESLIDMLAARGERALKTDKVFSVSKWMDIDSKFMVRYNDDDRVYVSRLLNEWKTAVQKLDITNMEAFQKHFDERPVVN